MDQPRAGLASLSPSRLAAAKRAFVTRRVAMAQAAKLASTVTPRAGDLMLARVLRLGQHPALQLENGRRASLFVGDEIIVACGNRYAPDQFEAVVPDDLSPCQLAAAGGIAAVVRQSHGRMRRATEIQPLGLIADAAGRVLNLTQFRLRDDPAVSCIGPRVIAVAGTAMNAGKTTAAAFLIRGLSRAGLRVSAAKVTGTGSAGDVMKFVDAGASPVVDFTDFGYASTYRVPTQELESILRQMVTCLARSEPDVIVLEVADGLFQQETAALIKSPLFRRLVQGIVFAAPDALSGAAGAEWLEHRGLTVLALAGVLTASPLAIREVARATQLPVLSPDDLATADIAVGLLGNTGGQRAGGIAS